MIVNSFRVTKLFGIIDADLAFKPDLNVIVGRNASGKTSVLSLLASFIHLDIESIRSMRFESAIAIVSHEGEDISIEAANDSDSAFLSIRWADRFVKTPLSEELAPGRPRRLSLGSALMAFYGVSSPVEVTDAVQAWTDVSRDFKRQVRLTFVRLDRTVVAINARGEELRDEGTSTFRNTGSPTARGAGDPLDLVLDATRERFLAFRRKLNVIRADAYRSLMRLHFNPIKPIEKSGNIADLEKKLGELRTRVGKSQFAKEIPGTQEFFSSLDSLLKQAKVAEPRKIGRKSLAEESLQFMLEMSERQIEGLLGIFDKEQAESIRAEQEFKTYIDVLERFLKESGKRLWFSDERFELAFYVPEIGEKKEGQGRSLKTLSSGERQIVIVLTYLAFLSGPNSIFIIDEPELSLHLRWQGYLMESLRQLRPEGGQILVATHSPEIVGRAVMNCIQLRQGYMPDIDEAADDQ